MPTACPDYLGSQDTFYVGSLKGVGRLYQQTYIDAYSKVEQHDYQLYLAINDIDHTKTEAIPPQTNGIYPQGTSANDSTCALWGYRAILLEFYQVTFRKKLYSGLEKLQKNLDA